MKSGKIVIALGVVLGAVLLQATVTQYVRIFDLAPALGLLMVIAISRTIDAEPAMLVAFTGGLLQDLLGGAPMGLWAIGFTVVAFATMKLRDKEAAETPLMLVGVLALSLVGLVVYALLGTLFGRGVITRPGVAWHLLVPALLNTLLAYPAFWLVRVAVRPGGRGRAR